MSNVTYTNRKAAKSSDSLRHRYTQTFKVKTFINFVFADKYRPIVKTNIFIYHLNMDVTRCYVVKQSIK